MNSLLKKFLVLVLFGWGSLAVAADHPAQSLVQDTVDGLLNLLQTEGDRVSSDPQFLRAQLEDRVVPHINFPLMTSRAIGKHWKKASTEQKKVLVKEYKEFLLNSYAGAVSEYKDGVVEYKPFKAGKKENQAVVKSTFKQSGAPDVPVVYKLVDRKDKWQIYDIEVSQLSIVTNNRSFFSAEISRNGIDGLIKLLQERNQ